MKPDPELQRFFVAGGTLWREAPSYIVRPADEELFRLALTGEYCNVLAARQMGKSSLMVRTANRLQDAGVRTPIIDISTLGGGISTPEAWFFGFIDELAVQLGLDEDIDAWWEEHANHNAVQRFNIFFRDVIFREVSSRVVIFVDEIDSALGVDFTDDFFAAIRALYNARASNPDFQRLTFVLLGVARPADLIRDRSRTPYNIGVNIHLSDFTLQELSPFQDVFESAYPDQGVKIVEWVLDWTNGQPYLTQKLCSEIIRLAESPCTPESVARIVTRLFLTEDARKESNLRAIRDRLESSPLKARMLQIYAQILSGRAVVDEERSTAKTELKLTGLVRSAAPDHEAGEHSELARLEVHNRIYRTVFDPAWVRKNLPQPRTRLAVILASMFTIVAFFIAGYALYQQRIQPALTFAEQFQSSRSPEVRLTSLARLFELDAHPDSDAYQLYASLSQREKLSLFSDLSNPQNVAEELVTVITATYQENENTLEGNELLSAMRLVLGQIGAAGAPGLKTEIEFWIKGRQEAGDRRNYSTAVSFYDSAWAESMTAGRLNYAVRFDRAMALIAAQVYNLAYEDLQTVWEQDAARQGAITAAIRSDAALAQYILALPAANPDILELITPPPPTRTVAPTRTSRPTSTHIPTATATQSPTPSLAPTGDLTSPYSGWITYGYGQETKREIFIMNPVSRSWLQVTTNGVIDEAPSFSPDSWKLVYASDRSQAGWELYSYDLRRGTEQQLTAFDGQARFPVWSPVPGDTRILFEGRTFTPSPEINIWMLDAATGGLEQLTFSGADSRPNWSPDGTRIVFGRPTRDTTGDGRISANDAADIHVLDLTSREVVNLTNSDGVDDINFAWSPDGAWIAFASVRFDVNGDGVVNLSDSQDLFLIHPDGSDERRLDLDGRQVFSPSWSPDGRFILVLVAEGAGQTAIWRYDSISGSFFRITDIGPYFNPRYSNSP